MALCPCPDCRTMVSPNATACPNCGRPYPARKRTSKAGQVAVAVFTTGFGGALSLFGLLMILSGPGISQDAGGTFLLLGLGVIMVGVFLLIYVLNRKDW